MGHMVKSTEVMGAMNRLVKVGDIRNTMQAMQKEMMKVRATPQANPHPRRRPPVRRRGALPCTEASRRLPHAACPVTCPVACPQAGLIEEMIDDQMDEMDEEDEEAADEEVMKVMEELNAVNTGGMTSAPTSQVQQQGGAAAAEDDAEEEQMRARLQELRG